MPRRDPNTAADQPFGFRHSRWRTWLRVRTPDVLYYRLGLIVPKARDCGDHDWHNSGPGIDGCYHCEVTRPTPPDAAWFDATWSGSAQEPDKEKRPKEPPTS